MALKLVLLDSKYKNQLNEMLDEWCAFNKEHPEANTSPGAIFRGDYKNDFDGYVKLMYDNKAAEEQGYAAATTFFLYDDERDIFIGAANIRHYLTESLLMFGGHIGDGIRPSERKKGYGTKLISMSLVECKKLGIDKVLITCNKSNIGSRKAIINNGGVKENEVLEDGEIVERYWINLN